MRDKVKLVSTVGSREWLQRGRPWGHQLAWAMVTVALLSVGLVGCSSDGETAPQGAGADTEAGPGETGTEGFSLPETADELLARSISFHDPDGAWQTGTFRLLQTATRPNGDDRSDSMEIAEGGSRFFLESQRSGKDFTLKTVGDEVELLVEGAMPSEEDAAALRLDTAGSLRMRNYYVYLYGLPMKLRDPGTLIDPLVRKVDYEGRPALEVKVSYDPEVGSDVWYFTFDPDTAAMIGYRFYHDEAANDGEYIKLKGLANIGGLSLPAERAWYKFEGDEYLGTDTIAGVVSG